MAPGQQSQAVRGVPWTAAIKCVVPDIKTRAQICVKVSLWEILALRSMAEGEFEGDTCRPSSPESTPAGSYMCGKLDPSSSGH